MERKTARKLAAIIFACLVGLGTLAGCYQPSENSRPFPAPVIDREVQAQDTGLAGFEGWAMVGGQPVPDGAVISLYQLDASGQDIDWRSDWFFVDRWSERATTLAQGGRYALTVPATTTVPIPGFFAVNGKRDWGRMAVPLEGITQTVDIDAWPTPPPVELGGVIGTPVGTPTPTPVQTATPTATSTVTPLPTQTPTALPTATPTTAPTDTPTPQPTPTPTPIPLESPVVAVSVEGTDIVLAWSPIEYADIYDVYRTNDPFFQPAAPIWTTGGTLYMDANAALQGEAWYYTVAARNADSVALSAVVGVIVAGDVIICEP